MIRCDLAHIAGIFDDARKCEGTYSTCSANVACHVGVITEKTARLIGRRIRLPGRIRRKEYCGKIKIRRALSPSRTGLQAVWHTPGREEMPVQPRYPWLIGHYELADFELYQLAGFRTFRRGYRLRRAPEVHI